MLGVTCAARSKPPLLVLSFPGKKAILGVVAHSALGGVPRHHKPTPGGGGRAHLWPTASLGGATFGQKRLGGGPGHQCPQGGKNEFHREEKKNSNWAKMSEIEKK